jgi:ABC-type transport system involved in cytochrome c biogenesis permease subunit
LGLLGLVLCIVGATKGIPWFGFIGSIMFLLIGVYTMIYGFDNVNNLYTQGAAIVFLGMGILFMFLSALEWVMDTDDEDTFGGEEEEEE